MIVKSKCILFLILISFLFSCSLIAQEKENKQTLVLIFNTLEQQHGVQFNYEKAVVEDIFVTAPTAELELNESIAFLQDQTGLLFVISGNFILVSRPEIMICGYLKDFISQTIISSATIQGSIDSAISDQNGYFELNVDSTSEEITIRHLGYKTLSISNNALKNDACSDIFLISDYELLSEVVISNYLVKGINKLQDGSLQIDFSDFSILPGLIETDVLQSIQALPGVLSVNETVSNINIRGGSHDQNLILWDDIKMYQSGHFFGLISMYNPQITQTVSLRKNGSDVKYTDGVSGTISMQTDNTVNTKFKGSLGVNLIDINGFADIPVGEKSSLQIAARKALSDFIKTPIYNEFFDRISQDTEVENNANNIINSDKEFDFYDTSFRWIYKISPKDELQLNFINVSNQLIFNENAMIDAVEESRQSRLTQNSIAGALHFKRIWNDQWRSNLEIYETDYKLKAVNANIFDSQRFLQENIVSETSAKITIDYKINDELNLSTGYHFVETEVTNLDDVDVPIFRLLISEVVRTHGFYSQIGYSSQNKKTNLIAGLRLNYIDKFSKTLLEPRLSLSQKFLDDFTLEILGEFKHQNTSQIINFQNDFLGIEKRRWQLSNDDDIPIIMSKQISLGINYSKNGWLVDAEGYYKNVDGITTQSQGFQNQYEFSRTDGSYDVVGLDFLLRKRIDNFNVWLSYAYMNNTYAFSNLQETEFRSNYDITHALTFGTAYTFNNLKFSAGLNWHSGKPTTLPVNNNEVVDDAVNFGSTNVDNLMDYFRVDVSAIYNFDLSNKTKANFGVSIWNLLNRKNEINNFFSVNNDSANETIQSSLGFTPNVVFRVFFN